MSRISVYETSAEKIYDFLHFEENISETEKDFALSALCSIVARLQAEEKQTNERLEFLEKKYLEAK